MNIFCVSCGNQLPLGRWAFPFINRINPDRGRCSTCEEIRFQKITHRFDIAAQKFSEGLAKWPFLILLACILCWSPAVFANDSSTIYVTLPNGQIVPYSATQNPEGHQLTIVNPNGQTVWLGDKDSSGNVMFHKIVPDPVVEEGEDFLSD